MINNLLLSMTTKKFIETIDYDNIKILEDKKNFYKEKYIKLKYFCYEGVHYELNRDFITYFVWLKSFINVDFIEINKENKMDIFHKYKLVIHFFNYILHLYIDYFFENNIFEIDEFNKKENILNIISKNYELQKPNILHPEFVFDNFIFHRKSYFFTNEEIIHTEKLFKLFEMFYYTLLNHMEEYEFNINEIDKELL